MIEFDWEMVVTLLLVVKQGLLEWWLADNQTIWKKHPWNYMGTNNSRKRG